MINCCHEISHGNVRSKFNSYVNFFVIAIMLLFLTEHNKFLQEENYYILIIADNFRNKTSPCNSDIAQNSSVSQISHSINRFGYGVKDNCSTTLIMPSRYDDTSQFTQVNVKNKQINRINSEEY